jgi:tetratricopeptide (TPR) repeat protein
MVVPTAALNETEPAVAGFDNLASARMLNEIKPSEQVKTPLTIAATFPATKQPADETTSHAVLPMVEEHWDVTYWNLLHSSHDLRVKSKMAAVERGLESRAEIAEDAYTQALALYKRHTPKAFAHAIVELKDALALKPDHGSSHAMLAAIYWGGLQFRWQLGRGLTWMDMLNRSKAHLSQADQLDPLVHMVRSEMLTASGQHDQAINVTKDAIALYGSSAVCQRPSQFVRWACARGGSVDPRCHSSRSSRIPLSVRVGASTVQYE